DRSIQVDVPVAGLYVTSNTCPGVSGVFELYPLYEIHAWLPLAGSMWMLLMNRLGVTASSSSRVQLTAVAVRISRPWESSVTSTGSASTVLVMKHPPGVDVVGDEPPAGGGRRPRGRDVGGGPLERCDGRAGPGAPGHIGQRGGAE